MTINYSAIRGCSGLLREETEFETLETMLGWCLHNLHKPAVLCQDPLVCGIFLGHRRRGWCHQRVYHASDSQQLAHHIYKNMHLVNYHYVLETLFLFVCEVGGG